MIDFQRAVAPERPWSERASVDPWARDLGDLALWSASTRRSLERRVRAQRPGSGARNATAVLAVGVAVAASAAGLPAVSEASRGGTGVASLQRTLGVEADGIMGPRTQRAIRRFQRAHGLAADGVVGPLTRAALAGASGAADSRTTKAALPQGTGVADLQRRLGVDADGVYGPQTRRALRAFQSSQGLEVDGVVGPATRAALGMAQDAPAAGVDRTRDVSAQAQAPAEGAGAVVAAARAQVGKPYGSGGNGPASFDCSGLTTHAFRAAGVSLARTSYAQFGEGSAVDRDAIQAGDLVFFDTNGPGASHVGVATGPSSVISATSHGVMETSIDSSYWSSHYVGARRVSA